MTVFMDTFALIAWLHPRDPYYDKVSNWLAEYRGNFVTTESVLLEFGDALCSSRLRGIVVQFLEAVRSDPLFEIVPHDQPVIDAGFKLFAARPDKDWSLTDCISFQVMTARSLTDALTADHHYEQAGFRALFKD